MATEFFCLCMSPALDATVTLTAWPSNGVIFKDVSETENVGGKGINVARWLALRDAKVACGGLLGADNAAPFEHEMSSHGIGDAFMRVPGVTRRNEMIVTPEGSFKINRPAFPKLSVDFNALAAIDADRIAGGSSAATTSSPQRVAILSGSLPPAVPRVFYATAIRMLKERGWKTVLDASGEALLLGLDAKPDLIKPNADECEPIVGFVPRTPDEFRQATAILNEKVPFAIISDGGAGAWFNGEFVAAPQVDVLDTTSAGDTLLAEFCWRWFNGADCISAAKWAVAAGSAAVTMPGSVPPPEKLVENLKENIT